MSSFPKFLFYAVDGLGLGHVTRLLSIARQIRILCKDAEIFFLTSSEADNVIYKEGFSAFKVPSKTLREQTSIRKSTYSKVVQVATWNVISAFAPDIMVVDTYPAGTLQELLPILRWKQKMVFVFREQKVNKANSVFIQNTLQLYDRIIVPHDLNETNIPLPEGSNVVWTGPIMIRDKTELRKKEDVINELGLPTDKKIVYVSFGGGGEEQMNNCLTILNDVIKSRSDLHFVVAMGPLYRQNHSSSCQWNIIKNKNTTLLTDYYPIVETFSVYDMGISASGYNSVNELLHNGIPSIFIPFSRMLDDQEERARRIESQGAGIALYPLTETNLLNALNKLSSENLRKEISEKAKRIVPENGARKSAEAIIELLG